MRDMYPHMAFVMMVKVVGNELPVLACFLQTIFDFP